MNLGKPVTKCDHHIADYFQVQMPDKTFISDVQPEFVYDLLRKVALPSQKSLLEIQR